MKCRYTHCIHGGEVDKEEAVKEGNSYYHKDCLCEKQNKEKIQEIYCKYYDTKEPISKIKKCINDLINKNINSEFILYCLCQYIRQGKPMRNIFGLTYIVSDPEYEKSYKKIKAQEKIKNFKNNKKDIETVDQRCYTYKRKEKKKWSDIIF